MTKASSIWRNLTTYFVILSVLSFPLYIHRNSLISLFIVTAINILLAQGLNILTGFVGIVSIGQAGFFAIGAYSSALLMIKGGLPLVLSLPSAVVISGIIGFIVSLPSGRVRHFYLAMLTFAFGLLIYYILKEWRYVGGVNGIPSIPSPTLGNLEVFGLGIDLSRYYMIVLSVLIVVSWMLNNVIKSHIGRAMMTIQHNEPTAGVMGLRTGRIRQIAFVLSACVTGVAGVLYAHYITFLGPDSFTDMVSVYILVYAVLGGLGNLVGPFLGAGLLTILPQQLNIFAQYQLLIYGALLFFSFTLFPRGLTGILNLRTKFIRPNIIPRSEETKSSFDFAYLQTAETDNKSGTDILLETKNLTKYFGGLLALNQVNISIKKGEIHGLIGPNGSGKTTLINLITGIYKVSEGTILFEGHDVTKLSAPKIASLGLARNFQSPQLSAHLTVLESVLVGGHMHYKTNTAAVMLSTKRSRREERYFIDEAQSLLNEMGLLGIQNDLTKNLPYGKQRMVELVRSLMCHPRLLILDEPAAGLSEAEMNELALLMRKLNGIGLTIIIIEHHMEFVLNLIDSVAVLDNGSLIYAGNVEGMKASKEVQEAYLGGQQVEAIAIGS